MSNRIKNLTLTAMFAALIMLATYSIRIPIGLNGGYIHLGDSIIYLCAVILPMPYALAAASIGGGLADLLSGAPIWIIPTMLIKPLSILMFRRGDKPLGVKNLLALLIAGVISNAGYYLAEAIFTGSMLVPFITLMGGIIQWVGSAAVYAVLAFMLPKLRLGKN